MELFPLQHCITIEDLFKHLKPNLMRILRRPGGVLEYTTSKIRLRLKPIPDTQQSLLIIHQLKPNGYIRNKMTIEIDSPEEMTDIIAIFQVWAQNMG